MNSRNLVLFSFAAWSLFCSWWYVCHIKDACQTRIAVPAAPAETEPAAIVPAEPEPSPAVAIETPPAPAPQESAPPVEKVTVEEKGDDAVIHFPYNSTQKEANNAIEDYLERLAAQLKSSSKTVTINGHTDGIGDAKTNVAFAERRAKNIRDLLLKKGVGRGQIKVKTFGESKPVATNDTPEGRYQNRRVEMIISE